MVMESDLGKLFAGGISWETTEDNLKEYFKNYGEVLETVIMKDRTTGHSRGFGFVVFADPAVADKVVLEKHMIDGRMVEAKKAVPRDDQYILNRNMGNMQGLASPGRTKKIFVGGLASTVTESDFKKYFDQFGTITDVVVMYDHNTQRPRGFGFITYGSEEAADRVLLNVYHELNGKMVEVKRAVPKASSPGPTRSPLRGVDYDLNKVRNFFNGYPQGYSTSSLGGYQMRMDPRISPLPASRAGYSTISPPNFGISANFGPSMGSSFSRDNCNGSLSFAGNLNAYSNLNPTRYSSQLGCGLDTRASETFFNAHGQNVWGNGGLSYPSSSYNSINFAISGSGSFGNSASTWGSSSSVGLQGRGNNPGYTNGLLGYGNFENGYGLGGSSFAGGSGESNISLTSFSATNRNYNGSYVDLYGSSSAYGDSTWRSEISEIDGSASFDYEIGNSTRDMRTTTPGSYVEGYNATHRQPN